MRTLGTMVAVLILIASLCLFYCAWIFQQPNSLSQDQYYVLEKGVGVRALAKNLSEQHLIRDPMPFLLFAVLTGDYKKLQAGEYFIHAHEPMASLLNKMAMGKVYKRFVTIPEGKTSIEIIRILDSAPYLTGAVTIIPAEGSLLPETYAYTRGEDKNKLIERMQDAMNVLLGGLMAAQIPPHPLVSRNDVITLASIVEKETGQRDERRRVAGVFLNRLNRGIKLETDPTVIYGITKGNHALGGQGPLGRRLTLDDLKTPSPYNTYLNMGLPPTPIANPGRASIEAVLNPEVHDFIFFVADGTGGHAFARNFAEHQSNVARWRQVRAAQ